MHNYQSNGKNKIYTESKRNNCRYSSLLGETDDCMQITNTTNSALVPPKRNFNHINQLKFRN
ncbi:hypothetical protein KSS87_003351 [Heliosperma pusillum]|nr:hypothetical protein KSS87_001033 [Heliosperma pusillum]KAH9623336.1 hypothetical protein KSS87_003351 [Heliosperma pusillum]